MASYSALYHIFFNYVQPFGWDNFYTMVLSPCYMDDCEWFLRWVTAGEYVPVSEEDFYKFVMGMALVVADLETVNEDLELMDDSMLLEEPTNVEVDYLDSEDEGLSMGYGLPSRDFRLLLPVSNLRDDATLNTNHTTDVLLPFGFVNAPQTFQLFLGGSFDGEEEASGENVSMDGGES